jgi:hypothetical protein
MNVSPGRLDTLNLFSNKAKAEPGEVTCYYYRRQDSKKERANIYAAIMASITSTVKEAYLYANATNNQCGIHLAVWLYLTYANDTNWKSRHYKIYFFKLFFPKLKSLVTLVGT